MILALIIGCFLVFCLGAFLGAVVAICSAGDAIVGLLKPVLPDTGKE